MDRLPTKAFNYTLSSQSEYLQHLIDNSSGFEVARDRGYDEL